MNPLPKPLFRFDVSGMFLPGDTYDPIRSIYKRRPSRHPGIISTNCEASTPRKTFIQKEAEPSTKSNTVVRFRPNKLTNYTARRVIAGITLREIRGAEILRVSLDPSIDRRLSTSHTSDQSNGSSKTCGLRTRPNGVYSHDGSCLYL